MSFFKTLWIGNEVKSENKTEIQKKEEKKLLSFEDENNLSSNGSIYSEETSKEQLIQQSKQLLLQFLNKNEFAKIYEQCQPKLEEIIPDQRKYDQIFRNVEKEMITYAKSFSWNPKSQQNYTSFYQSLPIMKKQQISFPAEEYLKSLLEKNNIFNSLFQILQLWTQEILDNQRKMIRTEVEPLPQQFLFCFPEDIKKQLIDVNKKIFESERGRIGVEQNIRKCFEDLLTKYFSTPELSYSKEDSFEELSQKLRQVTKEFVVKQIQLNNLQIPTLIEKCQREWEKRNIQLPPKEEKDNLCSSLQALIDNLLSQYDKLKETSEREMQRQRKELEQVEHTLRECKTNHETEEKKFNEKIKDIQKETQNRENEKKTLSKINKQMEEQINLLNFNNIQGLENMIKEMEKLKQDHDNEITRIKAINQIETMQAIEKIREQNVIQVKQLTENTQQILKTKGEQIIQLSEEVIELESKYQELQVKLENWDPFDRLFSHDILLYKPEHKKFLAQSLQDRYSSPVSHTKLICTLDPLNKVNFHQYLDKVPCLMIIARLQNQRLVAAFSISPFVKGSKGEDSLIFSITNRQVFFLKKEGRAITYDDCLLIFGNSELIFKSGEMSVYSNFSAHNGSFIPRNNSVDILFGEGPRTREMPIISYEVFQVMFENGLHMKYKIT